jgi:hypothetical protein
LAAVGADVRYSGLAGNAIAYLVEYTFAKGRKLDVLATLLELGVDSAAEDEYGDSVLSYFEKELPDALVSKSRSDKKRASDCYHNTNLFGSVM